MNKRVKYAMWMQMPTAYVLEKINTDKTVPQFKIARNDIFLLKRQTLTNTTKC